MDKFFQMPVKILGDDGTIKEVESSALYKSASGARESIGNIFSKFTKPTETKPTEGTSIGMPSPTSKTAYFQPETPAGYGESKELTPFKIAEKAITATSKLWGLPGGIATGAVKPLPGETVEDWYGRQKGFAEEVGGAIKEIGYKLSPQEQYITTSPWAEKAGAIGTFIGAIAEPFGPELKAMASGKSFFTKGMDLFDALAKETDAQKSFKILRDMPEFAKESDDTLIGLAERTSKVSTKEEVGKTVGNFVNEKTAEATVKKTTAKEQNRINDIVSDVARGMSDTDLIRKYKEANYRNIAELRDLIKKEVSNTFKSETDISNIYKGSSSINSDDIVNRVITEMDLAEAGSRIRTETGEYIAKRSTFSEWVPIELRKKTLFDKVVGKAENINNIKYPTNAKATKEIALVDAIYDKLDMELGVNTSKLREEIKQTMYGLKEDVAKPQLKEEIVVDGIKIDEIIPGFKTPEELAAMEKYQQTKIKEAQITVAAEEAQAKAIEKMPDEYIDEVFKEEIIAGETTLPTADKVSIFNKGKQKMTEYKDKFITAMQDAMLPVKKFEQSLGVRYDLKGGQLTPYESEQLLKSKTSVALEHSNQMKESGVKDILTTAEKNGLKYEDVKKEVNKYAQATHAIDVNKEKVATKALKDGKVAAAGITTDEANKIIAEAQTKPYFKEVQEIVQKIRNINRSALDMLVKSQVIDQELYDTLVKKYPNYIPLNRIIEETIDVGTQLISGKGTDVKSTGIKKLKGSLLEVDDVIDNTFANYEQAIIRAHKNEYNLSIKKFADEYMDTGMFKYIQPPFVGKTEDERIIRGLIADPNVIHFFSEGKHKFLEVKNSALAEAYKRTNFKDTTNPIFEIMRMGANWVSLTSTGMSPEFWLKNKPRDIMDLMISLSAEKGIETKKIASALTDDIQSIRDVASSMMGKNTDGTKEYIRMREAGGTTSTGYGFTKDDIRKSIDDIEKTMQSNPRMAMQKVIDFVQKTNVVFEDSTRLTAWKQAKKAGYSDEKAALFAKNATVNFDKKGTLGPTMSALYAFSNASVQGTARMVKSFRDPKVAAAVSATMAGSTYTINQWNNSVDPDWRSKVQKSDTLNGMVFMLGSDENDGARYVTIPIPWSLKPLNVMFNGALAAMDGKGQSVNDLMKDFMGTAINSVNPVGGTDFFQAITPSLADPIADIYRNRKWTGQKLYPDMNPKLSMYEKYYDSLDDTWLGRQSIAGTRYLAEKTNKVVDLNPASVKYLIDSMVGGTGKFLDKNITTIRSITQGELPKTSETPFVSSFYKKVPTEQMGGSSIETMAKDLAREAADLQQDRHRQAEKLFIDMQKMSKEERVTKIKEVQNGDKLLYKQLKTVVEDNKAGLNNEDRAIKNLLIQDGTRAMVLYKKISSIQTKEERVKYIEDMKKKKILTPTVMEQIKSLINK